MNDCWTNLRLRLVLIWSQTSLWLEGLLDLLFPAILFPALFVGLALFGWFDRYGDPLRILVLLTCLAAGGWFLRRQLRANQKKTQISTERRAEQDARLPAGTLGSLHDHPAGAPDRPAQILWQAHQQKMRQKIRSLQVQPPKAVWMRRDPWALRAILVFGLLLGAGLAGNSWMSRISDAFYPGILERSEGHALIEAWINPPKYTDLPPQFLTGPNETTIQALAGSEFVVRVSGARRPPRLRVQGKSGQRQKLTALGAGVYEGRLQVDGETELILSGGVNGIWHLSARQDRAPQIAFIEPPNANEHDALVLGVQATDDFGIEKVELQIETEAEGYFAKSDQIELVVPTGKLLEQTIDLDLTRHILAGLPVRLTLLATDGAGQTTRSAPAQMKLPRKLVIQPLAKAIAEQRLLIMRDPRPYQDKAKIPAREALDAAIYLGGTRLFEETDGERLKRAPAQIRRTVALMSSIMRAPETGVKDPYVWLGLSYVHHRLYTAKRREDLNDLDAEMWEIMLRAEGGELESAAAALKLAEQALQRSLLLSDPPSEVQRLSQKYEMAVKRYLQALAKQALENQQDGQDGGSGQNMSAEQLQEMLDALQALAETGANMDARTLLKALAALLENMKMQLAAGGQGDGEQDDLVAEAMRKALEELGEMLGKQKELLDGAQQQQGAQGSGEGTPQQGQSQSGQASGSLQELSGQQGSLQGQLQELGKSGALEGSKAQGALGKAEAAMGEAAKALGQGQLETGLAEGQKAFNQLREGAEGLAQEMLDRKDGQQARGKRDPFGRSSNGGMQSAEGTEVPDLVDPQTARKILLEIRRRAAEQQRSREERKYLDRLLERF
jgi:hypothetical protein